MPEQEVLDWAKTKNANVTITSNAQEAVKNAHMVVTDTWVSMGDRDGESRIKLLTPYQVDNKLMTLADKQAVFMHCLPAHRGEEVVGEVIDGAQSVVWDEAENRLHVQKALLLWCLDKI